MTLDEPHVGMQRIGIEPVAVCLPLRVRHVRAKIVGRQFAGLSFGEYGSLEIKPGKDVDEYLAAVLQVQLEKSEAGFPVGLREFGIEHDGLGKYRGGLGESHRIVLLESRKVLDDI